MLSKTVIVKNYYFLSETESLNKLIEIIRTLPVDQDRVFLEHQISMTLNFEVWTVSD